MSVLTTAVAQLAAHTATAYCIEFDRSGKLFATGGADGLVCVFDVKDNVCLRSFDRLECVVALLPALAATRCSPMCSSLRRQAVRSVAFSHDSRYIASGSEDSFVSISDVRSGTRVRAIACGAPTNAVSWHPSRHCLAFANDADGSSSARTDIGVISVSS